MAPDRYQRRLIVNADDFGLSPAVNEAVVRAHREGILTSASLMVNEPAAAAAAALARDNPRLGVGLHLTLIGGRSALPREEIPGLVNGAGRFGNESVALGCRYFFRRGLREQLGREIAAQFEKFRATGLPLDHVNGHCHLHMQPVVFGLLMEQAETWGIQHFRLMYEPFGVNARAASGRWFGRALEMAVFGCLARWCRPQLRRRGIRHPRLVFGQMQNGQVNEDYLLKLLLQLPRGDSELYSHPSLDQFKHEFDALVSPRVRAMADEQKIRLIRYQDL
jgi:chitin disaccharide deacetylase